MPAAVFTFFGAVIEALVGSFTAPADSTGAAAAALRTCVRYGVQQAGNPLAAAFQTAASLISIAVVWPWHGVGVSSADRGGAAAPALWEHLQRFCWTEGQLHETAAVRDAASASGRMHEVRSL